MDCKFRIYRKTVLKYLRVDCSFNSTIKKLDLALIDWMFYAKMSSVYRPRRTIAGIKGLFNVKTLLAEEQNTGCTV